MPGEILTSGNYLSIIQGTVRKKVDKDTEGAKRRDYEVKDGGETKQGTKYEIIYKNWGGRLVDLIVKDGPYGEVLEIKFPDATLSIPTESRYFQDFAEKIKTAKLDQEITICPYDFEGEGGKKKVGMNIFQGGMENENKLKNYYYDEAEEKWCNGLPQAPKAYDQMKKTDWKIFFATLTNFLLGELEKIKADLENIDVPVVEEEPEGDSATEEEVGMQKDDSKVTMEDVGDALDKSDGVEHIPVQDRPF